MLKIAFYGKGGIGKSTIAANISAALAQEGNRVLHIGCDPKADSARSLIPGRMPTVLNRVSELGSDMKREDILRVGPSGISCIEAGGPTAGNGCAGMGITVMEDELQRLGILTEDWDAIIYDVLGDVVCGGFAMPIRRHYADLVYIVTSADYMSVFAANNILRGIAGFARSADDRFGGIILNHRHGATDDRLLAEYCKKTGAELLAGIQESYELKLADYNRQTIFEFAPNSAAAADFRKLAEVMNNSRGFAIPTALSEEDMERFGQAIIQAEMEQYHG